MKKIIFNILFIILIMLLIMLLIIFFYFLFDYIYLFQFKTEDDYYIYDTFFENKIRYYFFEPRQPNFWNRPCPWLNFTIYGYGFQPTNGIVLSAIGACASFTLITVVGTSFVVNTIRNVWS